MLFLMVCELGGLPSSMDHIAQMGEGAILARVGIPGETIALDRIAIAAYEGGRRGPVLFCVHCR